MARFPLYIEMKNRRVIIVGGGTVALRKARVLADFEADIHVISPEFNDGFAEMVNRGMITCEKEYWTAAALSRLDTAFMVICATGDRQLNAEIADYCRIHRIWVDCADSETASSCIFPSIVRRKEIVIGISTSGGVPILARHLRQRIEKMIPEWYGELENILRIKRNKLKRTALSSREKRRILNEMIIEAERRHLE